MVDASVVAERFEVVIWRCRLCGCWAPEWPEEVLHRQQCSGASDEWQIDRLVAVAPLPSVPK